MVTPPPAAWSTGGCAHEPIRVWAYGPLWRGRVDSPSCMMSNQGRNSLWLRTHLGWPSIVLQLVIWEAPWATTNLFQKLVHVRNPSTGHFGDWTSCIYELKSLSLKNLPFLIPLQTPLGITSHWALTLPALEQPPKSQNGLKHRSRPKQELLGYSLSHQLLACSPVCWYWRIDLHSIFQTCNRTPMPTKLLTSTYDEQFKYL